VDGRVRERCFLYSQFPRLASEIATVLCVQSDVSPNARSRYVSAQKIRRSLATLSRADENAVEGKRCQAHAEHLGVVCTLLTEATPYGLALVNSTAVLLRLPMSDYVNVFVASGRVLIRAQFHSKTSTCAHTAV
jgi:hypothetical protein